MRKIIRGKIYDTSTAHQLLHGEWYTYHPNLSEREPSLRHERGLYRTKKGALFAYTFDRTGYGRDRNGVTGAFTGESETIQEFTTAGEALFWVEYQNEYRDIFDPDDIEKALGDVLEEA
jgi:hypothetical protein